MTTHTIGFLPYIFTILLFIFIYLWIGTNKFQKGWAKMVFTTKNVNFGNGFVDVRLCVFITLILGLLLWRVFFS
jgi:hypothetical protein